MAADRLGLGSIRRGSFMPSRLRVRSGVGTVPGTLGFLLVGSWCRFAGVGCGAG